MIVLFIDDDDMSAVIVTSQDEEVGGDSNDDDFVVVIPDCFKLDVPLDGFTPPVMEPLSPVRENPVTNSNILTTPTPEDNTVSTPISNDNKDATPIPEDIPEEAQTETQTPPTSKSPNSIHKPFGLFGRDTLEAAWTSRSTNPFRYAVGVVNTVTELVDQHVHFMSQQSNENDDDSTATPPNPSTTPPNNTTATPSFTLPTPPELSDITCQESDTSRFLNNKWEGPKDAKSPSDNLVSMGFANRDLNRRLLEKHNGNLQQVIQELLDSNGEGFI